MVNTQPVGWTDELLICEIRAGGKRCNTAWEYIYKAWRGYYLSPVLRMGGSEEQVDEIFSGVAMDLQKQVLKEDFILRVASLRTYFIDGIIKAWSRSRRIEQRRQTIEFDPKTPGVEQPGNVEEDYIRQERLQRLDALLAKLGEKCRIILMRFAQDYSMREIADELGFENEQSAKNAKGKCHRKLLELTGEI